MLVPPATPPSPTPAPTPSLASAYGAVLEPRQTNYFNYYSDCNYNDAIKCTSIVSNCYDDMLYASDYRSATSCFCTYGISYLDCFFSNFATGSCASYFGVTGNWGDYQMSFYKSYCGSIPPSAMAQMQVPTSVSLDFDKVQVVTTTGALQPPKYDGKPDYEGQGDLLKGDCAKTGFTQVDAGNTVYYAGFVGCIKDRPECCPYTVNTAPSGAAATETAEAAQDKAGFDFPQPVSSGQFLMARCASDYYSISGGCCPNGYWPFTTAVGGQTPCWSSIDPVTAPKLTIEKGATTKEKPTSAVINIVWSMRYPVADSSSSGLSTAAKAGIGAGAGIAAILIAGLAFCLWRSRRKNKKLKEAQAEGTAPPVMTVPPTQQQPQTTQPPAEFKGAYLVPSPSTRTSVVTTATPATLIPQNTGTSNGGLSDLSSQNGYFAGAAANNPRLSYSSSNGAVSPPVGQQQGGYPYPAAIAEADEGQYQQQQQQQQQYPPQQQQQYQQYQYPQQYGYPPQQGQPPQQQYYNPAQGQGQGQGQGQYYQQPQGGYGYPPTQQQQYPQQQQGWNGGHGNANVPEMSAQREADPPQEVMGSNVPEVRGS